MDGCNIFFRSEHTGYTAFHELFPDRRMLCFKRGDIQDKPSAFIRMHAAVPRLLCLLFQQIPQFPRLAGQLCQMDRCSGIDVALQQRDHAMPDPVARIDILFIRGICTPLSPLLPQKFLDLPAPGPEKRTDPVPAYRPDPAQAPQTRTSGNIQKNGFCIVIPVVGRGNLRTVIFSAHFLQSRPTHHAPRLLQRLFPFCGD